MDGRLYGTVGRRHAGGGDEELPSRSRGFAALQRTVITERFTRIASDKSCIGSRSTTRLHGAFTGELPFRQSVRVSTSMHATRATTVDRHPLRRSRSREDATRRRPRNEAAARRRSRSRCRLPGDGGRRRQPRIRFACAPAQVDATRCICQPATRLPSCATRCCTCCMETAGNATAG